MQQQYRLRRSADFDRVRAEGRVWRHPFLTLSVAPNGLDHNRYGFVLSRRLGVAVVRNRVRRVLREIARLATPKLKAGYDITFVGRNEIVGQPYKTVQEVLETQFKRASLWKEE